VISRDPDGGAAIVQRLLALANHHVSNREAHPD
jgi:hypothetical protein